MSVQVVQAALVVGEHSVDVQVPLGQVAQEAQLSSPSSKVPAAQTVHEAWPELGCTEPSAQAGQDVWPVEAWAVPTAQSVHEVWPVEAWYDPAAQAVHAAAP